MKYNYTNSELESIHLAKVKIYTEDLMDKFKSKEYVEICIKECLGFAEAPMDTRMLEDMLKALSEQH